jgi:hypothetical protein
MVDQRAVDEETPHRFTASSANARAAKIIAATTLPATVHATVANASTA